MRFDSSLLAIFGINHFNDDKTMNKNENLKKGKKFGEGQDPTKGGRKKSVFNQTWEILIGSDETERKINIPKNDKFKMLECLLEMPVSKLQQIAQNEEIPVFILNIVAAIVNDVQEGKTTTIDKYFDRFYGKAQDNVTLSGNVDAPLVTHVRILREDLENDNLM